MPRFVSDCLKVQIKNIPLWLMKELNGLENLVFTSGKGADLLLNQFLRLSNDQQMVFRKCYDLCKIYITEEIKKNREYKMQDIFYKAVDPLVRNEMEQKLFRKLLAVIFALKRAIKKTSKANKHEEELILILTLPTACQDNCQIKTIDSDNYQQPDLLLGISFRELSWKDHYTSIFLEYKYDLRKKYS